MLLSVARSEVARRKRGVKAESRTVIDAAHKAIGPPLPHAPRRRPSVPRQRRRPRCGQAPHS
jgi:hypothetical protein